MIQLRDLDNDRETIELAPDTKCQLIDGLLYVETKKVQTIGAVTTLQELRAFEMVQVDTGFDDDEQPRIMAILPKRKHGIAMLIATTVMALGLFGCSGATYHYSCYGDCGMPAPVTMYSPHVVPAYGQVQYVNRPHEIFVRDGHIDTSNYNTRRAATPRKRRQP
jgi:hypothetical protein